MKKKIWIIGLGMLSVIQGISQPKTALGQSDPAAKTILDGVSRAFRSYKTISADFQLKVDGPNQSMEDTRNGTVLLEGTKYRVFFENQELYCDGKTTWTYTKDANEVQVNNYDPGSGTITPSRLFTNFYDKEFLYRLDEETTSSHGKKIASIELTPLDKARPFFKVNLTVDEKEHLISKAVVFDKSGNRYTYQIAHFKPNVPVSDTMFVFNPATHPHADVVDLR